MERFNERAKDFSIELSVLEGSVRFLTEFGMTFGLGKLAKMRSIFAIPSNERVLPSGVRNPLQRGTITEQSIVVIGNGVRNLKK